MNKTYLSGVIGTKQQEEQKSFVGVQRIPTHKMHHILNKTVFHVFNEDTRAQRVMCLLVGIIMLSLADLLLTSIYLTSVGMSEANPIAAWLLMRTNSLWILALYKGVTVATCVLLLYYMRNSRQGELAAWCSMLILTTLSVWWNQYAIYQPCFPAGDDQIVMIQEEEPVIGTFRDPQQSHTLLQ